MQSRVRFGLRATKGMFETWLCTLDAEGGLVYSFQPVWRTQEEWEELLLEGKYALDELIAEHEIVAEPKVVTVKERSFRWTMWLHCWRARLLGREILISYGEDNYRIIPQEGEKQCLVRVQARTSE